jgi:hypothetical protein
MPVSDQRRTKRESGASAVLSRRTVTGGRTSAGFVTSADRYAMRHAPSLPSRRAWRVRASSVSAAMWSLLRPTFIDWYEDRRSASARHWPATRFSLSPGSRDRDGAGWRAAGPGAEQQILLQALATAIAGLIRRNNCHNHRTSPVCCRSDPSPADPMPRRLAIGAHGPNSLTRH